MSKRWINSFIHLMGMLVFVFSSMLGSGCQSMEHAGLMGVQHTGGFLGPQGAPWSILCMELTGEYSKQQIEQIAETLRRTKGIRSKLINIQHEPGEGYSRLYYGKYYRKIDVTTGKRSTPKKMVSDLTFLRSLADSHGKYFFLRARKVRYPTPHVGRKEWDLQQAVGVYTLQVGVFEPTIDFYEYKLAAAQFCKQLRDRGFEAFYHHTEAGSTVTVGQFGEDAVIAQPTGLPRYSQEVLAIQQSDDLLRYNRLNGAVYKAKSDRGVQISVPSRLVRIPHSDEVW